MGGRKGVKRIVLRTLAICWSPYQLDLVSLREVAPCPLLLPRPLHSPISACLCISRGRNTLTCESVATAHPLPETAGQADGRSHG